MGEDARTNGTSALTAAAGDTVALRAQIEQTRAEFGDTVAALAAKTDVKAHARDRIAELKLKANEHRGPLTAAGAVLAALVVLKIARR